MLWHVSFLSHSKQLYNSIVFKSTWKTFWNIKHNNQISHYSIGTSSTVNFCYNKITKFPLYPQLPAEFTIFPTVEAYPTILFNNTALGSQHTQHIPQNSASLPFSAFSFMHNIYHLLTYYVIYIFTYVFVLYPC